MADRARRAALAVGLAAALVGCETPLGPSDPGGDVLSGEWTACLDLNGADERRVLQFFPDSFLSTSRTYATTDGTCGGAETGSTWKIWRYTLRSGVPARIGAAGLEVVAREMNVEDSFETLFTIVYVDQAATPNLLYFGDLAFDPLYDGSAPDRRPRLLSDADPLAGD